MKRLSSLLLLLVLSSGCASFDDCPARYDHPQASSCGVPVRTCGDGSVIQAGARVPAQTAEPPR